MVNFNNIKHFYFLGIGGIGMSALARYFMVKDKEVAGYDKTPTTITDALIKEGVSLHFEDSISNLPDFLSGDVVNPEVVIVYTPAVPKSSAEMTHLSSIGYRLWKRSEILGAVASQSTTIAVAGTHGKTTTSTMIAHILKYNKINCTAFLGGISKNYNTNLLLPDGDHKDEVMVVEADEYDRSFLTLFPDYAVITSMDPDHLDIYGDHQAMITSYNDFASQVKEHGVLLHKAGLPLEGGKARHLTYSSQETADYIAENIRVENGNYVFNVSHHDKNYGEFTLTWPGRHNVENATAAIGICSEFGLSIEAIKGALLKFSGVKRRFDYIIRNENIIFIDDYAHHPSELSAAIQSVKELYPGKKILGIFQPHLFTRTRDFAGDFSKSLSLLDELIMLDIYPARELPIPGVTSDTILEKVKIKSKSISAKSDLVLNILGSEADIILTLGAGDIDAMVEPIKTALENKYKSAKA